MSRSNFHAAATAIFLALSAGGALLGCGSDDKKDVAKFIGTWSIETGALTGACPPLAFPMQAIPKGEQVVFTAGTDSDLLIERSGCKIKFDVKGDVATAQTGQSCGAMIANPLPTGGGGLISITLGVTKATFTIQGSMGTLDQSGNLTLPLPALSGCTYGILATATKTP
jgi:hypothetical protein